MERILINNEWYVKESSQEVEEDIDVDFHFTNSCIVETDNFCFEAIRMLKSDNEGFYPDISIDVTIKKGDIKSWKKEFWDNPEWMRGIMAGDKNCLEELIETVTDRYDQQVFIKMLWKLDKIGWL
jgi:hypothetical protein